MYLFDTEALDHALSLPLDAKLRRLLRERVDHLATLDRAVADTTYFLVVDRDVSPADIMAELGWSPLTDLDGGRYGAEGFSPFHDYCADHGGWYEILYSTSNEAVVVLLVKDDEGTDADLLSYCRSCVAEAAAQLVG